MKTSDGTVQGPAEGTPQARHEKQQQQPQPTQNDATQATSQQQQQQKEGKTTEPKINKNKKDDPWAAATPGTPGQDWEPDSWTPTAARR